MDTLYDLLGALPHDNAESLRTAFRKAVKGAHPDLRPGDPDAGVKFRQIVRANEILGDAEQRAAYDHLLMLARIEKNPASAHPIATRVHRVASGVMAIAIASIVTTGGYFVFMHMSMALVAPANIADASTNGLPQVEVARADAASGVTVRSIAAEETAASIARPDPVDETIVPHAVTVIQVESTPPIDISVGAPADPAPNDAGYFRSRGISAYRNGDLDGAIFDLDQAILLDPKSSVSYIDRGIVLHRMGKYDRAFADIGRAKEIEKGRVSRPTPGPPRKLHLDHAQAVPAAKPKPRPLPQQAQPQPQPPRRVTESYTQPRFEGYAATFQ
jgi:tetratricopeptide (TPR) repeat protein